MTELQPFDQLPLRADRIEKLQVIRSGRGARCRLVHALAARGGPDTALSLSIQVDVLLMVVVGGRGSLPVG